MTQFPHLFSPIKIGPMTVRNRIYSSPHHPLFEMFLPGERSVKYWATKARGGIGLIGTQLTSVHPYKAEANVFRWKGALDSFKRAADAVHEHGAKILWQMAHTGGQGGSFRSPVAWAPSPVPIGNSQGQPYVPHEMTKQEIRDMIAAFAHAATVLKEAGVDGIEIHGAHGYMVNQFMSPRTNIRTDEYGGSLEKRLRFPIELIDAIRSAVGKDFVLGMRLSGDEFVDKGNTLEDVVKIAPILAGTGKIDYLNISAGTYTSIAAAIDPMYYPLNSFVYLASAIKEVVDIPVFARGRITDPVQAEQILANNQADMVSMVRAIMADPDWPNKVREGKVDEIRKCIGCNEACWGSVFFGASLIPRSVGITCTMNPVIGKESEPGWVDLQPAAVKKRVMVIGGGPAGLEAARVAALRGHKVSLYDKGPELGGAALIAAKAPLRDGFLDLARYYTYQMKALNVEVHLNAEVTPDMVKKLDPDAVVVATGAIPVVPPNVPGTDGKNVVGVREVLNEQVQVGDNVVVIGYDEHMQSMSVADFLAERGKKVQVLGMGWYLGSHIEDTTRQTIYQRLLSKGVVLSPLTAVKDISGSTVTVYNVFTHEERTIEDVDTVVMACGGRENNSLYYALEGQVKELHKVGDANGVRKIMDATADGAAVGRAL